MTIWAFNKAGNNSERKAIHQSVKNGVSRFGWSIEDKHNLLNREGSDWHSKQFFLLHIQKGDWIVHISTPEYGKCIMAQVIDTYHFDEGIKCADRYDYRHCIKVNPDTIIEFDRKDPRIPDSVNLAPRSRYQRVYAADELLHAVSLIKSGSSNTGVTRLDHIRKGTTEFLPQITKLIQQMNRGKELERFLAEVFRTMPNVIDVKENGFGYGTDYGADLIVLIGNSFAGIEFDSKVIVQVKSYSGDHNDMNAIDQILTGMKKYEGDKGILFTTASSTPELESYANEHDVAIIAGDDIARFVLKHCPSFIFDLSDY